MPADKTGQPNWPTATRYRLADGRIAGTDGSVWLYKAVPMAPVVDAINSAAGLAAAGPLMAAMEEMAALATVRVKRRSTSKGAYRQVHMLLVNIPQSFKPAREHPLADYLMQMFPNTDVSRRVLLFGARLMDNVGGSKGIRGAVDSVVETLVSGTTPISDFDRDFSRVDAALSRCGLRTPRADEFRLANAWWNYGRFPDTPLLIHTDHLHVFSSADSARAAAELGRADCTHWPSIAGHHALTFATVQDIEMPLISAVDPRAHWVPALLDAGAVAVSIRARVEPPSVTRQELRRRRKQYTDDINERLSAGKMERAEQEEMLAALTEVEAVYAAGGPPTLIETSVIAAFDGDDRDRSGRNVESIGSDKGLTLNEMVARQEAALAETWMCSAIRANPHLHDFPAHTLACSGLPSLSTVGDETGMLLGLTERDRQPSYISPTAAADEDQLPILVCVGQTGSGKATSLDTRIPTPSGWTTMGDLKVGDQVYGRDGRACKVTFATPIQYDHELFEVLFSDGQIIKADLDHQWVVSNWGDRHHPSRQNAITRWDASRTTIEELYELAEIHAGQSGGLFHLFSIVGHVSGLPWRTIEGVRQALNFVGCPFRIGSARVLGDQHNRALRIYDVDIALKSLAVRVEQSFGERPCDGVDERRITTGEMLAAGLRHAGTVKFSVRLPKPLDGPEVDLTIDPYVVGVYLGDGTAANGSIASATSPLCTDAYGVTDQEHMIRQLAQYGAKPQTAKKDVLLSTYGLASDLRKIGLLHNKHIPTSYLRASRNQRLALLQGLMDTDGYVLHNQMCGISLSDERLIEQVFELVRSLGYKATIGRYQNTAPPTKAQREAGIVARRRTRDRWEIRFMTADPVFRLPRKLVKQATKIGERSKSLHVISINPIPSEPVRCIQVDSPDHTYLVEGFVPTSNTQTMLWLADQASRIRNALGQLTPLIVIDPKLGSDHSLAVKSSGGQVASLDSLMTADGVFDPLRFAVNPEVGVEVASSMLMSINPWGPDKDTYEVPLISALSHGISLGARSTGEALQLAADAGEAPQRMVDAVFSLAKASPMFRACCGVTPESTPLRVSEGITLIKVGEANLDLPEPGQIASATLQQRVALALVRMMVFGSAMALSGRQGVICLDEAWVFLGAGRSEMERLGRLARSQGVFPMLFTQRVTDALNAGMAGYISRGLILPIQDRAEAEAACELFKLEPTPERMARLTAKATRGGTGTAQDGAPNWDSMRALRDRATGKVLRGAVGVYSDLAGRAVPVEVIIPPEFLARASTTPDDIRRRDTEQRVVALTKEAAPTEQEPQTPVESATVPVNGWNSDWPDIATPTRTTIGVASEDSDDDWA